MTITFGTVLQLAQFSVQNPKAAARHVMALNLPGSARWAVLALSACASTILSHLTFGLLPPESQDFLAMTMASPMWTALFQLMLLLGTAFAVHAVGRWQGGHGQFDDALLLVGWLQVTLILLQAAQMLAMVVSVALAELIGLASLAIAFWMLTHFIMELHGFHSAWRVFLGIVAVLLLASMGFAAILMTMLGEGALANV